MFAFGLAPLVFVAAHFYTLIRYDMLAENVRHLVNDLATIVLPEADRMRCRQLLANVEFVNALVMPEGSRASSWMFVWTVRALLAGFPVAVLLVVQLQSLRLQSEVVSWTHHVCMFADLVLLIWFFGRLRGDDTWHFRTVPIRRKVALCWLPFVVLTVNLAWLQVPEPDSATVGKSIEEYELKYYDGSSVPVLAQLRWWVAFNPVDLLLCTPGAWGCRFLTVAHRIVVPKVLDAATFVDLRAGADADAKHRASIEAASLRGRTLRFADLTGSELIAADLTDVDLRHAKLMSANLKGAVLIRAQIQDAYLSRAKLQGADLEQARLQGADLEEAQLQDANLRGVQLQQGFLRATQLQGANLHTAQLQGADLFGAQFQGADLRDAQLQGAKLRHTQLQGADLSGAQLQAAYLRQTQFHGAVLRGTELQGAVLHDARLQGVDLRHASLWNIDDDERTSLALSDLRGVSFAPVSAGELDALLDATPEAARQGLRTGLSPKAEAQPLPRRVDTTDGKILVDKPDDPAWSHLDRTQLTTDPAEIDSALAELLANTVALAAPQAAESVARRVTDPQSEDKQRPLLKLLGCRLQAQADSRRVTFRAETIGALRKTTGPCDQP